MELIETQLTDFTRRSRSLSIRHADTRLSRGLEYGERVLVRSDREYRTAVVADVEFSIDDTHYRLVLGGVVPTEVAEARLLGEITVTREDADKSWITVAEIETLLSKAGSAQRIPMQRQVARRLLDR